jgi:hypothetical protein
MMFTQHYYLETDYEVKGQNYLYLHASTSANIIQLLLNDQAIPYIIFVVVGLICVLILLGSCEHK